MAESYVTAACSRIRSGRLCRFYFKQIVAWSYPTIFHKNIAAVTDGNPVRIDPVSEQNHIIYIYIFTIDEHHLPMRCIDECNSLHRYIGTTREIQRMPRMQTQIGKIHDTIPADDKIFFTFARKKESHW